MKVKVFAFLGSFIFGGAVQAAPAIVESVSKDGRRAIFSIPADVTLSPGDTVYTTQEASSSLLSQRQSQLRGRDNLLAFEYSVIRTTGEIKASYLGPSEEASQDQSSLSVVYGRNFGRVMPWIGAAANMVKADGGGELTISAVSIGLQVNIIENLPGNDLIPFASIGFGQRGESGDGYKLSGSFFTLEGGLIWYPFSEHVGIKISLFGNSGEISEGDLSVDVKQTGFGAGYVLTF